MNRPNLNGRQYVVLFSILLFACTGDRVPVDNRVDSTLLPGLEVEIDSSYRYIGSNRFVLREHTDVEQHFFSTTNDSGDLERLYWIQFERMLPDFAGAYRYPASSPIQIGPVTFLAHLRHYTKSPVSDSDRGVAYRYLADQGLDVPTPAARARLVHIPELDNRSEMMIVYLEPVNDTEPMSTEKQEAMLLAAIDGLTVHQLD